MIVFWFGTILNNRWFSPFSQLQSKSGVFNSGMVPHIIFSSSLKTQLLTMVIEPRLWPRVRCWCDSYSMCRCSALRCMLPSDRTCSGDSRLLFSEFRKTLCSAPIMWMCILWLHFHRPHSHWRPHNQSMDRHISIIFHRNDTHWSSPKMSSSRCVPAVALNRFRWTPIRRRLNSMRSVGNVHWWILSKTTQWLCKLWQTTMPDQS